MFDTNLLNVLCCPESRGALKLADDACLAAVNNAIAAGSLKNIAGEKISEKMWPLFPRTESASTRFARVFRYFCLTKRLRFH